MEADVVAALAQAPLDLVEQARLADAVVAADREHARRALASPPRAPRRRVRSSSLRPTKRPNASRRPAHVLHEDAGDARRRAVGVGERLELEERLDLPHRRRARWRRAPRARARARAPCRAATPSRSSSVGSPARDTWMRPCASPAPGGRAASRLRSATSAQRVAISVSRPSGSPRPKSAAMCPASRRRTRPPQRSTRLAALSTTGGGASSRGSSMTSAGHLAPLAHLGGAVDRGVSGRPMRDPDARRAGRAAGTSTGVRSVAGVRLGSSIGAGDGAAGARSSSTRGTARGTRPGRARRSGCPARRGTRGAPRTCARRRGSARPASLAIAVLRIATSSGGRRGRSSSTGGYSHACTRRSVSNVVGALNGFTPGDALVEHGAEREEVAPRVDGLAARLLGAHVAELALELRARGSSASSTRARRAPWRCRSR